MIDKKFRQPGLLVGGLVRRGNGERQGDTRGGVDSHFAVWLGAKLLEDSCNGTQGTVKFNQQGCRQKNQ